MVLGLLAKPTAAIFPAILFGYIFLFEEAPGPKRLLSTLRQCGKAILVVAVVMLIEARMTPATFAPGTVSAHDYISTQPYVALHYFISFFFPLTLTADTDLSAFTSTFTTDGMMGLLFLAALIWCIWWTARKPRTRPISFGLLWFLLALLPTSLFPLSEVENDHRMFMPFVGLALAVAWTLALTIEARFRPRAEVIAAASILLLALYGAGVWQRNRVWSSEESLWKDVTIKSPHNGRDLMNYGLTLMARGRSAEALSYFEQAAVLTPNYATLEINRGIANGLFGNDAEAQNHFNRALQLNPNDAQPYYFFGRWMHQKHRDAESANLLRSSVEKNADYTAAAL